MRYSADRDNNSKCCVDDRHNGQVAGQIAFDVAHDLQETELGVAVAEHRDQVGAQLNLADQKEQQRAEKQ